MIKVGIAHVRWYATNDEKAWDRPPPGGLTGGAGLVTGAPRLFSKEETIESGSPCLRTGLAVSSLWLSSRWFTVERIDRPSHGLRYWDSSVVGMVQYPDVLRSFFAFHNYVLLLGDGCQRSDQTVAAGASC